MIDREESISVTGRGRSGRILMSVFCVAAFLFAASGAFSIEPTHLGIANNPVGCEACHQGHGKRGTAMLRSAKSEVCFTCHGPSGGVGRIRAKTDMSTVFNKRYKHPVLETSMYHSPGEDLPEQNSASPRHVACDDCHKVHLAEAGNSLKGVRGYTKTRTRQREAKEEYELCYECHADSVNLPYTSKNKKNEFDSANASFHPVEGPGRSTAVPSLLPPLNIRSTITCTDCHGNDDVYGPKGPHGSSYEFMLKKRHTKTESSESPQAYELCYSCHNRDSILINASFKSHKEHIVYQHVPCSACHTSHGSVQNANLIQFDSTFTGYVPMPTYMTSKGGKPLCFLKCHIGGRDVIHDNAFYKLKRWPQ